MTSQQAMGKRGGPHTGSLQAALLNFGFRVWETLQPALLAPHAPSEVVLQRVPAGLGHAGDGVVARRAPRDDRAVPADA